MSPMLSNPHPLEERKHRFQPKEWAPGTPRHMAFTEKVKEQHHRESVLQQFASEARTEPHVVNATRLGRLETLMACVQNLLNGGPLTEGEPFYRMVPKTLDANLQFRREVAHLAYGSKEVANALWQMCARDMLFYINVFTWTVDPRQRRLPATIPFITYPFQDRVLRALDSAIGDHDLQIAKSRDQGMTWLTLMALDWRWRFFPGQTFLVVSRKQALVDKAGEITALLPRLDKNIEEQRKLWPWIVPHVYRVLLFMRNEDNGSQIVGDSTTGDVGRAGRYTSIMLDEHAFMENQEQIDKATQRATPSRLFISTPNGPDNVFARRWSTGAGKRLRVHWSSHPIQRRGLYMATHDKVELLDPHHPPPPNYKFVRDGCLRSPWYDNECRRVNNPAEIGQELDINFRTSAYTFFYIKLLRTLMNRDGAPPMHRGSLQLEQRFARPLGFTRDIEGPLCMWHDVDDFGRPTPQHSYIIGCDIALGTQDESHRGASESVASIIDRMTQRKVAELVVNGVEPQDFAPMVAGLGNWYKNAAGVEAFVIWEANGPGVIFGNALLKIGYQNLYYRRQVERMDAPHGSGSRLPGLQSNRTVRVAIFSDYRQALGKNFINPSVRALQSCEGWVRTRDGDVVHRRGKVSTNPDDARMAHGDLMVADALAWHALCNDAKPLQEGEVKPVIPLDSMAGRRMAYERQKRIARPGGHRWTRIAV